MRKLLGLFFAASVFLFGSLAQAETLEVNPKRLVRVNYTVDGRAVASGAQLLSLSESSKEPIFIQINSFGGAIYPGLQFVSAMEIAKARGVTLKCFVTNVAMSMAFYYLTHCDERYVLPYSLLLWHPAKAGLMGSFDQDTLRSISEDLERLENPMIEDMLVRTGIDRAVFMKHYKLESIWVGYTLKQLAPNFITVVDDITGVDGLFSGVAGD